MVSSKLESESNPRNFPQVRLSDFEEWIGDADSELRYLAITAIKDREQELTSAATRYNTAMLQAGNNAQSEIDMTHKQRWFESLKNGIVGMVSTGSLFVVLATGVKFWTETPDKDPRVLVIGGGLAVTNRMGEILGGKPLTPEETIVGASLVLSAIALTTVFAVNENFIQVQQIDEKHKEKAKKSLGLD